MGAKLKVIGRENIEAGHSYVVMGNHCSYLDIPALFIAMPFHIHFIAKKELRKMPFLGWYMMLSDMIFIDRKNTAKAKESLADAVKLVSKGKHVVIFPEGTASKNGAMNTFKKGGFFMAEDAEAYIIPTHIKGTFKIFPSSNKLNMRRGTITVCIGKPISPEEYTKFEMDKRVDFIKQKILDL
jgi:1-acyl-sn-glycerol-3-phosphate acyltransferase